MVKRRAVFSDAVYFFLYYYVTCRVRIFFFFINARVFYDVVFTWEEKNPNTNKAIKISFS